MIQLFRGVNSYRRRALAARPQEARGTPTCWREPMAQGPRTSAAGAVQLRRNSCLCSLQGVGHRPERPTRQLRLSLHCYLRLSTTIHPATPTRAPAGGLFQRGDVERRVGAEVDAEQAAVERGPGCGRPTVADRVLARVDDDQRGVVPSRRFRPEGLKRGRFVAVAQAHHTSAPQGRAPGRRAVSRSLRATRPRDRRQPAGARYIRPMPSRTPPWRGLVPIAQGKMDGRTSSGPEWASRRTRTLDASRARW